jgi:bacterioferritin-associated ferredoxin
MASFRAELKGRDWIEIQTTDNASEKAQINAMGCTELLSLLRKHQVQFGKDPRHWPVPQGSSHAELLLKEVLLKSRGQWSYPYTHDELCHCRSVATEKVDQAVIAGAHRCEVVSRQTGASTACGTCRPEVQKIIDFRLKNQAS